MTDQVLYRKYYRCIEADPPWYFKSYAPPEKDARNRRDVERHYETLSLADIQQMPIKELAHPDGCHLFLWSTGPCLPQAIETMNKWGFKYSGIAFTWVKTKKRMAQSELLTTEMIESAFHIGLGLTTRKNSEICLLGRRGNCRRKSKSVRELIVSPRREHSRKPPEARQRIEQYCDGPYLSMFSREQRAGWATWGDQATLFDEKAL